MNPIYVDINIAEQDYMRFSGDKPVEHTGQNLELILGDGDRLSAPRPALSSSTAKWTREREPFRCGAEFPNPGNVLRPGQYARIRAVTELRKAHF